MGQVSTIMTFLVLISTASSSNIAGGSAVQDSARSSTYSWSTSQSPSSAEDRLFIITKKMSIPIDIPIIERSLTKRGDVEAVEPQPGAASKEIENLPDGNKICLQFGIGYI